MREAGLSLSSGSQSSAEVAVGDIRVFMHGTDGPTVVVLHGGPAAAGSARPIARGLARHFRVLEPWQRGSGPTPLSVAVHIEDLHAVVRALSGAHPPAVVGESWGAMLALAYAAAHPESAGPLVLVGCGTFDPAARAQITRTLEKRMDGDLRRRLRAVEAEVDDEGARTVKRYELIRPLYSFDPIHEEGDATPPLDVPAHRQTWDDMLRLQREGVYPAAFAGIRSPALMLHGAHDPHPGRMIRDSLLPHIPQLEYHEFKRCGHHPWQERHVREEFFGVLRAWLSHRLERAGHGVPDQILS